MVAPIYDHRTFCVGDHGQISADRTQATGIAQGCPLSPYLFIMVLTVIFNRVDAVLGVDPQVTPSQDNSHVLDVTYADDTLLISSSRCSTQTYLNTLIEMAEPYGLQPNWDKTLHLRIGHAEELFGPQGELLKTANQAVYLGALLTDTGRAATSLA